MHDYDNDILSSSLFCSPCLRGWAGGERYLRMSATRPSSVHFLCKLSYLVYLPMRRQIFLPADSCPSLSCVWDSLLSASGPSPPCNERWRTARGVIPCRSRYCPRSIWPMHPSGWQSHLVSQSVPKVDGRPLGIVGMLRVLSSKLFQSSCR